VSSTYKTYPEYLRTPLFRIARAVAFRRANGRCEDCHRKPASEVHHLRYPLWNSFDTPSNLRAVCHECHCIVEGKEW
jgi:hypothetical protein